MGKGVAKPTESNQTPNTVTVIMGVRLRVRRSVVERATAQTDS